LIINKNVFESLCMLDFVVAKLDAPNEKLYQEINRPVGNISHKDIIDGIKKFRKIYTGKFSIQTMFMNNNMDYVEEIANLVSDIEPDEVQINTPLRPCSIKPLSEKQIDKIEDLFKARNAMGLSGEQAAYMYRLGGLGEAIVRIPKIEEPFVLQIPKFPLE